MCKDNFQNGFTREEVSKIGKRVLEAPISDQEAQFFKFFESLRKRAELYSCLMFQKMKLVSFDPKGRYVVIRGQSGEEIKINLF